MSLVSTLMQPLRAKYPTNIDKNELRFSVYDAWKFFQDESRNQNGILNAEVEALAKRSEGNTLQLPVFNAQDVTIGNSRSCTVARSENETGLTTITFETFSFGFTMTPSRYGNNDINYQADFNRKLEKYLQKFLATLDERSLNILETAKNQYAGPAGQEITQYYPLVGDALQVTQAEKDFYLNNAGAILETMDFYGRKKIVGSTRLKPDVRFLENQGPSNDVNKQWQVPDFDFYFTNRLTNAPAIQSTHYLVEEGSVAVVNRNDRDSMLAHSVGTHKQWAEVQVPLVGLNMGSYYYEDCANQVDLDTSGTEHLEATKLEGFMWSTDIAWMTTYISDRAADFAPIQKVEISST